MSFVWIAVAEYGLEVVWQNVERPIDDPYVDDRLEIRHNPVVWSSNGEHNESSQVKKDKFSTDAVWTFHCPCSMCTQQDIQQQSPFHRSSKRQAEQAVSRLNDKLMSLRPFSAPYPTRRKGSTQNRQRRTPKYTKPAKRSSPLNKTAQPAFDITAFGKMKTLALTKYRNLAPRQPRPASADGVSKKSPRKQVMQFTLPQGQTQRPQSANWQLLTGETLAQQLGWSTLIPNSVTEPTTGSHSVRMWYSQEPITAKPVSPITTPSKPAGSPNAGFSNSAMKSDIDRFSSSGSPNGSPSHQPRPPIRERPSSANTISRRLMYEANESMLSPRLGSRPTTPRFIPETPLGGEEGGVGGGRSVVTTATHKGKSKVLGDVKVSHFPAVTQNLVDMGICELMANMVLRYRSLTTAVMASFESWIFTAFGDAFMCYSSFSK